MSYREETTTPNFVNNLYTISVFGAISLLVILSTLLLAFGINLLISTQVRGAGLLFVFVYFILGGLGLHYVWGLRRHEAFSYRRTLANARNYFRSKRMEVYATAALMLFVFFLTLTGLYTPLDELFFPPKFNYHPTFMMVFFLPVLIGGTLLNPVSVFVTVTLGIPGLNLIFGVVPIFFEAVYLSLIVRIVIRGIRKNKPSPSRPA
ncbi:MAG: hypothetical protein ACE5KO_05420 [Candidatus Bathyarchaeia archaeon]